MTQRQRRILWCHNHGYYIAQLILGSNLLTLSVAWCFFCFGHRLFPWSLIVAAASLLIGLTGVCLWHDDTPTYQAAANAKQTEESIVAEVARRRKEAREEAEREIIAETGYGLGSALWHDMEVIRKAWERLNEGEASM